jgi:glycosyltransferase involved in cell wall biosynthesis
MRVVLLANYVADRQPSMLRFARLLHDELVLRGVEVEMWHPPPLIGGRSQADGALHKWLGYLDKYLLYPPRLSRSAGQERAGSTVVHICDHSNAVYLSWLRSVAHVVTCHDLIAVRSALGEFPHAPTRWTGRYLQRMILNGLRQSSRIVCDSEATRDDVRRLVGAGVGEQVIGPGVARPFRQVSREQAAARLAHLRVPARFLLHVGGSQWYKNRRGLLDLYAALVARMPTAPSLVLVGKPLTHAEAEPLTAHPLGNRVTIIPAIADEDLAALYSSAELLVFPSLIEGFGWPILEAMASGCRVVATGRPPMTEIAGDAATYLDPGDPRSAAAIVESVLLESTIDRQKRIAAGLAHASRFSVAAMADAYLTVYHDAIERRSHAA